jgi:hypothetical protein
MMPSAKSSKRSLRCVRNRAAHRLTSSQSSKSR